MAPRQEPYVEIPLDGAAHAGDLHAPAGSRGIVLFAHGSGSSRRSPRNRAVAAALNRRRIATFLFDLLTEEEDRDYTRRFAIDLLAERLLAATAWVTDASGSGDLRVGYFGASTGASTRWCRAAGGRISPASICGA